MKQAWRIYHIILLPSQALVAGADTALVAVLPVGAVGVERLLDENDVVVAEAEAVKEGGAVLVAALDGGDDLSSGKRNKGGIVGSDGHNMPQSYEKESQITNTSHIYL